MDVSATVKYVRVRVNNVDARVMDNGKRGDHFMTCGVDKGVSAKNITASMMDNRAWTNNNM